jgi:alanine dehydrogenase
VPRTSTLALTNATLPYVRALADLGWREALQRDAGLAGGLNVHGGQITHEVVARALGLAAHPLR